MSYSVYIRPLAIPDAQTSYKWRNNPRIWRFTGSRPDKYITPEIETEWLSTVLKRDNERRFAICLLDNDLYIGNIFFTTIENKEAEMHVFIGEMEYWGKNRAYEAICLIFDYGFTELGIDNIYVRINPQNSAALALGKLAGFTKVSDYFDESKDMLLERMDFTRDMYMQKAHILSFCPENEES